MYHLPSSPVAGLWEQRRHSRAEGTGVPVLFSASGKELPFLIETPRGALTGAMICQRCQAAEDGVADVMPLPDREAEQEDVSSEMPLPGKCPREA